MAVSRRDGKAGQDVLRPGSAKHQVLILISLADGPKHGYALIQDIKELTGVELGPGTLYGALDRLERLGLIDPLPAEDRRIPTALPRRGRPRFACTSIRLSESARPGGCGCSSGGI